MTFPDELAARLAGNVVVVGVGNPLRGDDAAGCMLARRLQGRCAARVIEAQEVPESFTGDIAAAAPDTVVLVDAVDLGAHPGAVAVIEEGQVATYAPTTHRLPLSLLMEVVRRRTGADVLLIAVQPAGADFGAAMSPAVADTVEGLARILAELLRAHRGRPTATDAARTVGEGLP